MTRYIAAETETELKQKLGIISYATVPPLCVTHSNNVERVCGTTRDDAIDIKRRGYTRKNTGRKERKYANVGREY